MLHAGLDIGSLYTKATVLRDGALAGFAVRKTGDDSQGAAEAALAEALGPLGATRGDLAGLGVTGVGAKALQADARQVTGVLALARGTRHLVPEARGAIDLGGESTHVVRLDPEGQVQEFARNDKCAAGTGIFLDAMAALMGVPVPEMGPISLTAKGEVEVSATCVVFAESEVVSAVHRQTPKEDILRGIHKSIAVRAHGLVNRLGLGAPLVAVGGLALNTGILACLEELAGHRLTLPEEPRVASALGAALLAAEAPGGAALAAPADRSDPQGGIPG